MSSELQRAVGRIEGTVDAVQKDVAEMKTSLHSALVYIEQQKGARRATVAISTTAATFVGFLAGIVGTWLTK